MKRAGYKLFISITIFLIMVIIPEKAGAKVYTESRKTGGIFMVTGTGSLFIGADVTGIEKDYASSWKANITKINVSKKNKYLISKDGVLYNKKMTELIYYPSYSKRSYFKVPGTVKTIGRHAFAGSRYLKKVVLNKGLKKIGGSAFENSSINSVNIPSSVKELEGNCFSGCMELETVDNRAELTEISGSTFKNCIKLKKLNLGSSLISVYGSFYNCGAELYVGAENEYYKTVDGVLYTKNMRELINYPGLKKGDYKLPDKVITINEEAFQYCHNLKRLALNENITEFRLKWLCGCTSLEVLNLPASLEIVDTDFEENYEDTTKENTYDKVYDDRGYTCDAVYDIPCLKRITLGNGNKHFKIYNGALYSYDYKVMWLMPFAKKSLKIHKNTQFIVNKRCQNNFRRIIVPEENKYFASYMGVLYDKAIEVIEVFPGKKNKYKIPPSVRNVDAIINYVVRLSDYGYFYGWGAFYVGGCNDVAANLKKITVDKGNKYFKSSDGVFYNYDMTKIYAYPHAKKGSFKIPDGVQSINPDAFSGAKYLTGLTLPSSLKSVAVHVAGCASLKKITFKEGIKKVYLYGGNEPDETSYYTGFRGGINIKNIYFPSTLYDINIDGINKSAVFHAYDNSAKHTTSYGQESDDWHSIRSIKDYIIDNGYGYKTRNVIANSI